MKAIICGLVLLVLLACPVSAYIANSSSVITSYTDTQFASQQYIPYQYEILLIGLGVACWVLMKYAQELEVMFGLLAIIIWGAAAWFAAYMSINEVFTLVDMTTGTTTVLYTQFVTPQPILQVILVVCFLFAIIIEVYVLFLRSADKATDNGLPGSGKVRMQ
jgi:hypothetical protein